MTHFPRPVIKRARDHLLHTLRKQKELPYSRFCIGNHEALIRADGVDAAWYWPESLIHQAASQLEHAGIVTIALLPKGSHSGEPTLKIIITAKGEKFLCSGKAFRCRKSRQSSGAAFNVANQTSSSEPPPQPECRPGATSHAKPGPAC
jgi:hypothetical protein